jgi:hypothetical protein
MADLSTTTEVMNNLVESEAKLGELNNRLTDIQQQYNGMAANTDIYSFFNFGNFYFWTVLAGLILLALGLLFLLVELSHPRARKPKDKYHVPSKKSVKKSVSKKIESKSAPVRKTGKKSVKIKVIKVN